MEPKSRDHEPDSTGMTIGGIHLTAREMDVLRLLPQRDLSLARIGTALGITQPRVSALLTVVKSRFGLDFKATREQVLMRAHELGFLDNNTEHA